MTAATERDGSLRSARRQATEVAVALGVSTTVGYGTLYYAFGVLARDMAADIGLSLTSVYGLYSLGMFMSGLVASRAGSLFDRFDPAGLMAAGSAAAALALCLWAALPGKWAFAFMVVVIQAISMLILYEAAFVTAAAYVPATARRTIAGITLIAGFASTIFWPLTAWLQNFLTWRQILFLFALLHLVFCLLPHLWLVRRPERREGRQGPAALRGDTRPRVDGARPRAIALGLIITGFAASAFVMTAIHLHLVGILEAIGLAAHAALIGALIGPAQVTGRLVEFALADRWSIFAVTLFSALAMPAGLLLLVATAPWVAGAALFAILFGLGQGLSYIARGVLPLEIFGAGGFGLLIGRINAARLIASSAAPFVTAAVFERAGATVAVHAVVLVGLAAATAFAALRPLLRRSRE
jgi:hypothetical protein